MFLNINRFSKLTKEAYKFRLMIADIENHTVISSSTWLVSIENGFVPNKVKALIMELAGCLPEPNKVYKIDKSLDAPEDVTSQYLIPMTRLIENADKADIKFIPTPIINDKYSPIRFLQNAKTAQIIAIPEDHYQMVDKNCINYEIEGEPTGPCSTADNKAPFYWYNSIGIIMIVPAKFADTGILEALATVDFNENEKEDL